MTSIGGDLEIYHNDALTSLTGLEGLTSIGGDLEIYKNDALTSLTGLENIDAGSIENLSIQNNTNLSECAVQSICDYLVSPNGYISISSNATGCNSPEEVDSLCNITNVQNFYNEYEISISPNPVNDQAVLSMNIQSKSSVEICIYNTTGICIKTWRYCNVQPGQKDFVLNMSKFRAGIYFCRVKVGNEMITKKIIRINE